MRHIFDASRAFCLLMFFWLVPITGNASSDAGIEIEIGKFSLSVYYDVATEYEEGADIYIRDPRFTLFALASVIQANRKAFEVIDHKLKIELYQREGGAGNYLSIIEDPQSQFIVISDEIIHGEFSQRIVKVLCEKYVGACKNSPVSQISLYQCKKPNCPGLIRFGSFPSFDSVNEKYGLKPPEIGRVKAKKMNMDNIYNFFEILE